MGTRSHEGSKNRVKALAWNTTYFKTRAKARRIHRS